MKTIIALLALISLAIAQKPVIFSSATGHEGNFYLFIAQTDIESGSSSELVKTFFSLGSSSTWDGISTFDTDEGVYYYVTDGSSGAFVLRADVFRSATLAPIGFPLDWVGQLDYDKLNKRILVAGTDAGQFRLVSFSTDESIKYSYVPGVMFSGEFRVSALDSTKQNYYYITAQKVNQTYSHIFINRLNLNGGALTTARLNCDHMVFPAKMIWDSRKQQLVVFGTKFDKGLSYYTQHISAAGECSAQQRIDFPIPNQITSWTYDEQTGRGYAAMVAGGITSTLYTFDASLGSIESNVTFGSGWLQPGQTMELVYV